MDVFWFIHPLLRHPHPRIYGYHQEIRQEIHETNCRQEVRPQGSLCPEESHQPESGEPAVRTQG